MSVTSLRSVGRLAMFRSSLATFSRRRCGTTSTTEDPAASSKKRELLSPTAELVDPYPVNSRTSSPASYFGSREPTLVDEENQYLSFDFTRRQSDIFSYDPKFTCPEEEDEAKKFRDYLDVYGEALEGREVYRGQDRDYEVSRDPQEWKVVEALLPPELIPPVPEKARYPSGFVRATAKPGDHPYFVHRTHMHMLPVYTMFNRKKMLMTTKIKRADGNLFALRKDLDKMLMEKYDMEFISQVAEVNSSVIYRGDFEEEFKNFLISKGF